MRGKHAAKAQNRRDTETHNRITELELQLAEAKKRAMAGERAELRLAAAQSRIKELTAQIATGDTDAVIRSQELADQALLTKQQADADRKDMRRFLVRAVRAAGLNTAWTESDYERMAELTGEKSKAHFMALLKHGTSNSMLTSPNLKRSLRAEARIERLRQTDPEVSIAYLEMGLDMVRADYDTTGEVDRDKIDNLQVGVDQLVKALSASP